MDGGELEGRGVGGERVGERWIWGAEAESIRMIDENVRLEQLFVDFEKEVGDT